jgi:hypothetical protein
MCVAQRFYWSKTVFADTDYIANVYDIPYRSNNPLLDCFTHTSNWIQHLSDEMQRPLANENFLFPGLASTGRLKFGSPVTRADIERLLEFYVKGSGLLLSRRGKFTTHCFRRGGAQWCFMWQPGQKWSLKAVKWWGGWAPMESVSQVHHVHISVTHRAGFD